MTTMPSLLNTSGFEPLGHAVLVLPYDPQIKTSLIQIPETLRAKSQMVESRAVVIAIGPCAWEDEPAPRAAVGDHVMISRYAGVILDPNDALDGKCYRCINDRDLFLKIPVKDSAGV